jgi:hypothetical protein
MQAALHPGMDCIPGNAKEDLKPQNHAAVYVTQTNSAQETRGVPKLQFSRRLMVHSTSKTQRMPITNMA